MSQNNLDSFNEFDWVGMGWDGYWGDGLLIPWACHLIFGGNFSTDQLLVVAIVGSNKLILFFEK